MITTDLKRRRTKIDTAAVYARYNRPIRAELPAERAEACAAVCVATTEQGNAACTTTCQVLTPSTDRARAGRPRTFAAMARDAYGGAA